MYGNSYQALSLDRINNQIRELENMRNQYQSLGQQVPSNTGITQNFQLAPNNQNVSKINYADNIEFVKRALVFEDTLFINKEYTILWVKDALGNVKTYDLKEIIELDEKDVKIAELEAKISMLEKGMMNNESNGNDAEDVNAKSSKSKSTSIQSNK